jgi:hypothetical protein
VTDELSPSTGPEGGSEAQTTTPVHRSARLTTRIDTATFLGCLLAVVGVIAGIVRVASRRESRCPDGQEWPKGEQDFTCYVHPHAFEGGAVIVTALMLGIIIGLLGFLARTAVARDRDAIDHPGRDV